MDSANKALSSNEQLLADEIERLKRHNHHATTSKYFGVRKRGAVVRAKDLTRQAAAIIITRSARTHFVSKRNKVSRFDIFLVARDLDKKHYGCWASVRTVLFAALYFTILVFQQQPQGPRVAHVPGYGEHLQRRPLPGRPLFLPLHWADDCWHR